MSDKEKEKHIGEEKRSIIISIAVLGLLMAAVCISFCLLGIKFGEDRNTSGSMDTLKKEITQIKKEQQETRKQLSRAQKNLDRLEDKADGLPDKVADKIGSMETTEPKGNGAGTDTNGHNGGNADKDPAGAEAATN